MWEDLISLHTGFKGLLWTSNNWFSYLCRRKLNSGLVKGKDIRSPVLHRIASSNGHSSFRSNLKFHSKKNRQNIFYPSFLIICIEITLLYSFPIMSKTVTKGHLVNFWHGENLLPLEVECGLVVDQWLERVQLGQELLLRRRTFVRILCASLGDVITGLGMKRETGQEL